MSRRSGNGGDALIGIIVIAFVVALIPWRIWGWFAIIGIGLMVLRWGARAIKRHLSTRQKSSDYRTLEQIMASSHRPPARASSSPAGGQPPALPIQVPPPATEPEFFSMLSQITDRFVDKEAEPAEFQLSGSRDAANPSEFQLPQRPPELSAARWIPQGQTVNVAGTTVPGGLLYVGTGRAAGGYNNPSLIQPHLNVRSTGNFTVSRTSYWPSYAELDPTARRAYLNWLVAGRRHPDCDIGYVFLFFYGLEQRVIVDGYSVVGPTEWQIIRDEITQLSAVYADGSPSFRTFAEGLLEWMAVVAVPERTYASALPPMVRSYSLPWPLKVALGQASIDRVPLSASLALAWVRYNPTVYLRTPASRCAEEFDQLFRARYGERYGTGLVLPKNRKKLAVVYRPASAGLQGRTELTRVVGDLPDVTGLSAPIEKLLELANQCTAELDGYSRALGKDASVRGTPAGRTLLPFEVWPTKAKAQVETLRGRCSGESGFTLPLDDFLRQVGTPDLSGDRIRALAGILATQGLGVEPDLLQGARVPGMSDPIVVFPLIATPEASRDSDEYKVAALTLQVAAAGAHADGEFSADEEQHLLQEIGSWRQLTEAQRRRLGAHLRLLTAAPVAISSLKKKLGSADSASKERIAALMVTLAQVDGTVSRAEMVLLEKVYAMLGLDSQHLFSSVHAAAAGSAVPERKPARGLKLDAKRIEALQRETATVTALLADVFKEDPADVTTDPAIELALPDTDSLMGLDGPHSALVRELLERAEWTRAELQGLATSLSLMLDGALETINDAAYDAFDYPLTEGDDPVEVNADVTERLKA
ncbi:TerB N-terminal domain-containing protein [Dyella silvae]|uniref:tellurite resistance TerB family protein n=1 Tax=Dyella silvae TaxID=2994424 RepID=UPI0022649084|nr:TerB N-terminal domain-containing protein [Dyella silvae]